VDLPDNMQRALARKAEAEREKRAKIIHAQANLKHHGRWRMQRRRLPPSRWPFSFEVEALPGFSGLGGQNPTRRSGAGVGGHKADYSNAKIARFQKNA
jgi:hypothetical protein